MSRKTTITCDVPGCGKQRREANHWFKVRRKCEDLHITSSESKLLSGIYEDACGEECAMKLVSQWFSEQKRKNVRPVSAESSPEVFKTMGTIVLDSDRSQANVNRKAEK